MAQEEKHTGMGIEIREAKPEDAKAIARLVNAHYGRLSGNTRLVEVMGTDETHRLQYFIERPSKIRRTVAMGETGTLFAYLQFGPWDSTRENEFVHSPLGRFFTSLREWPEYSALHLFVVHESERNYRGPGVTELLARLPVFDSAPGHTLNVPLAVTSDGTAYDPNYHRLLTRNGVRPTDRIGSVTTPGLPLPTYTAKLMIKHGPVQI